VSVGEGGGIEGVALHRCPPAINNEKKNSSASSPIRRIREEMTEGGRRRLGSLGEGNISREVTVRL